MALLTPRPLNPQAGAAAAPDGPPLHPQARAGRLLRQPLGLISGPGQAPVVAPPAPMEMPAALSLCSAASTRSRNRRGGRTQLGFCLDAVAHRAGHESKEPVAELVARTGAEQVQRQATAHGTALQLGRQRQ